MTIEQATNSRFSGGPADRIFTTEAIDHEFASRGYVVHSLRVAFNCNMIPDDVTPLLYQWDQGTPDRLQALEVDEQYLCQFRFGVPLALPYPHGVRLVDTIGVATKPLSDEDVTVLRDMQRTFADDDRRARA